MKRISVVAGVLMIMGCPLPAPAVDAGRLRDTNVDLTNDAYSPFDARLPALSLTDLPNDTWSYVPVPGAVCGNGSQAVIGVNPHAGASELLVIMQGGGACWNKANCIDDPEAAHINEDYTRAIFNSELGTIRMLSWDDRSAALNPFRTSTIVYVPYCTGDLHAGDAEQVYDPAMPAQITHHRGGHNIELFLDAMSSAWPGLAQIRVVGFSAGGYGTQLNWGRFADTWPSAQLSLLADCAPFVELDPTLYQEMRTRWNLYTPAGCTACATSFTAYDDFFNTAYPTSRFGLLATTRDRVLTHFFSESDMPGRVRTLLTDLNDNTTTRYFVLDTDVHVIMTAAAVVRSADGTLLLDWLLGWLNNTPVWHNTRP